MKRRTLLKAGFWTTLGLYFGCDPKFTDNNNDNENPTEKSKQLYIVDINQEPIKTGAVDTDKGSYEIKEGLCDIRYDVDKCVIAVDNHVITEAFIDDRFAYTIIHDDWEPFFAHYNIAGNGSNKFIKPILTYIDGDVNSTDYKNVEERLKVVGDGRAKTLTNNETLANFVIKLNQLKNDHGEHINKGEILNTEIRLKNNVLTTVIDEEIAQGLLHAEDCYAYPKGIEKSCIAGDHVLWNPIDTLIIDALYSMKYCKFDGLGFSKEN